MTDLLRPFAPSEQMLAHHGDRDVRPGLVDLAVNVRAGTRVRGHEFHRTTTTPTAGEPAAWQWRADDVTTEGFAHGNVHASYLHLHWAGVPGIADRFVRACRAARPVPA